MAQPDSWAGARPPSGVGSLSFHSAVCIRQASTIRSPRRRGDHASRSGVERGDESDLAAKLRCIRSDALRKSRMPRRAAFIRLDRRPKLLGLDERLQRSQHGSAATPRDSL